MATLEQQDIAALKGRITRLEARLAFLFEHLGLTFEADELAGDDPKVIEALQSNNMLEAIKAYRAAHGVGLEEAKKGIDEMRGRLGI
jgi:ribosomal protein L7/L12